MKSIAKQSVEELGGPRSVLSRQKADHIKLQQLLVDLSLSAPERARPLLIRIYRLAFPHAFAEEAVLWPVIRSALPDGHELTLQVEREHQRINELVDKLESATLGSHDWRLALEEAIALLKQDIRDEEDVLLPRLQEALGPNRMRLLGTQWALVRAIAPTRNHPIVSRRPPGNLLAALPLALLDRARDRIELQRHGRLSVLSRTLARASRSVEKLPGMKSGEDDATRIARTSASGWQAAGLTLGVLGTGLMFRWARSRS